MNKASEKFLIAKTVTICACVREQESRLPTGVTINGLGNSSNVTHFGSDDSSAWWWLWFARTTLPPTLIRADRKVSEDDLFGKLTGFPAGRELLFFEGSMKEIRVAAVIDCQAVTATIWFGRVQLCWAMGAACDHTFRF